MITYHYFTEDNGLKVSNLTRAQALECRTALHKLFGWPSEPADIEAELSRIEAQHTEGQRVYIGSIGDLSVTMIAEHTQSYTTLAGYIDAAAHELTQAAAEAHSTLPNGAWQHLAAKANALQLASFRCLWLDTNGHRWAPDRVPHYFAVELTHLCPECGNDKDNHDSQGCGVCPCEWAWGSEPRDTRRWTRAENAGASKGESTMKSRLIKSPENRARKLAALQAELAAVREHIQAHIAAGGALTDPELRQSRLDRARLQRTIGQLGENA